MSRDALGRGLFNTGHIDHDVHPLFLVMECLVDIVSFDGVV